MRKAFVRRIQRDQYLHVCFQFQCDPLGIDEYLTVVTKLSDSIDDLLQAISDSITDRINEYRKTDKKLEAEQFLNNLLVDIHGSDYPLSREKECLDLPFWYGEDMYLKIADTDYIVSLNAPSVDDMVLPSILMVGFPVYPFKFKTSFANLNDCIFGWYRKGNDSECIGNGYCYIPTSNDIGWKLKLVCIPKNGEEQGPQAEVTTKKCVMEGPGKCPFEDRHLFPFQKAVNGSFRIMTYNILADFYVGSTKQRKQNFPYCEPIALSMDYRKQLLFKEIIGYKADIICLQEVDKLLYIHELSPLLMSDNYDGIFKAKANNLPEGLACFYNTSKFVLLENFSFVLSKELQINPCLQKLWNTLKADRANLDNFLRRPTILQVAVLESVENTEQCLVIGNTHLRSYPDPEYIRLLQAGIATTCIESVASKMLHLLPGKKVSVVFCGDFNSTPEHSVYELLTQQVVKTDHHDWLDCNNTAKIKSIELSHSLNLDSAYGTPSFTNYTEDFVGCLDYIFYQKDTLQVTQVVPLPTLEEVKTHVALPSPLFPSDHLALVADLTGRD